MHGPTLLLLLLTYKVAVVLLPWVKSDWSDDCAYGKEMYIKKQLVNEIGTVFICIAKSPIGNLSLK